MLGLEYATDGTLEVAGRPIEVIVRDYVNDPNIAATQARELIEVEGVEVLVGAPSSGVTQGWSASPSTASCDGGPAAAKNLTGELFEPTTFRACRNSWHDALVLAPFWVDAIGPTYVSLPPTTPSGARKLGVRLCAQQAGATRRWTRSTPR